MRAIALFMLLGGCAGALPAAPTQSSPTASATAEPRLPAASARLVDAAGNEKGEATLRQVIGGVDVMLRVTDMAAGTYAVHVHDIGICVPPEFASAGPHYNPAGVRHGAHGGDLPNVVVGADGTGSVSATVADARLADLLAGDGVAAIIHAWPDDGATDPAGNAGPRLACGVFVPK
jgi:Cu-Zn family superoxide dismutase